MNQTIDCVEHPCSTGSCKG